MGSGLSRPKSSRIWVRNFASAVPASPASTMAGSPGASRMRKKLRMVMARTTARAFTTQPAMKPRWRMMVRLLLFEIGFGEIVVRTEAVTHHILQPDVMNRRPLQFDQPGERGLLGDDLLHLMVQVDTPFVLRLGRRFLEQP